MTEVLGLQRKCKSNSL